MSSAILYLAIVAIWAVVLVPRWLRPRPAQPAEQLTDQPAEPATPQPADAGRPGNAEPDGPPAPGEAGPPAEPVAPAEPVPPAEAVASAEAVTDPVPAPPSPAERRTDVLRARRRMLAALVTITIGAVGLAVTRIAASWVVIPPVVLLTGFLVLLREAAHSDAIRSRRTTQVRRPATPLVTGQEPAPARANVEASPHQVPITATAPEPEPAPDAEVIDISARVSDQVYDQYADATERAVGD